ncbi:MULTISPECIES: DUF4355 domain-containing protein [Eisenbergiella]|uniref:DUF4355 domain-containing protein n=1 Tax=Eisenbergiella TaxID=1432051 RepID=UPI0023F16986|nr:MULTISPECIES: DUF4355 domain-containing protein [Eisenbergiella]MDY2652740.1 DUF4355 domain-containing protein [Eisenbergiella porci]
MKYKTIRYLGRCRVPMNIQFFAEGDGAGAGGESGNGGGTGDGNTGEGNGEGQPPSFDDFLKNEGNQAEFDRRVQKAINTALTNAQQKWQALADDKLSEAEKLAKMTKEEKVQYLQQKHEKELADREADITRRELMAQAKNTLAEKEVPVSLADVLVYTDADSCNKSMTTVVAAFQEAVQKKVDDILKGGKPPKKAPETSDDGNGAQSFVDVIKKNQSKR